MLVKNVRVIEKGAIVCSFDLDLDLEKIAFVFRSLRWMKTNGYDWIGFPYQTYEDMDGEKKYFNFIKIDLSHKDSFEQKVFEQLKPLYQEAKKVCDIAPAVIANTFYKQKERLF